MSSKIDPYLAKAAKAANTTPERFAQKVRGLLSVRRCRDTRPRQRVFTAPVMKAISCVLGCRDTTNGAKRWKARS